MISGSPLFAAVGWATHRDHEERDDEDEQAEQVAHSTVPPSFPYIIGPTGRPVKGGIMGSAAPEFDLNAPDDLRGS